MAIYNIDDTAFGVATLCNELTHGSIAFVGVYTNTFNVLLASYIFDSLHHERGNALPGCVFCDSYTVDCAIARLVRQALGEPRAIVDGVILTLATKYGRNDTYRFAVVVKSDIAMLLTYVLLQNFDGRITILPLVYAERV